MDEVRTFWIHCSGQCSAGRTLDLFPYTDIPAAREPVESSRKPKESDSRKMSSDSGVCWKQKPHGILVIGLDYRVLQLNPAGCLLFDAGFSEEIMGTDVRTYIQTNDCLQIEEMHRAAREGRETCGKGRLIGLAGQVRWVEVTFAPLPASDGTVHASSVSSGMSPSKGVPIVGKLSSMLWPKCSQAPPPSSKRSPTFSRPLS